jgi:hypothetical protein
VTGRAAGARYTGFLKLLARFRCSCFLTFSPVYSLVHPGTLVPGTPVPGTSGTRSTAPFSLRFRTYTHSFILAPWFQEHRFQEPRGHVQLLPFPYASARILTRSSWYLGSRNPPSRNLGDTMTSPSLSKHKKSRRKTSYLGAANPRIISRNIIAIFILLFSRSIR